MSTSQLTTMLWFDNEAEDAAKYYTSIFKNSSIKHVQYYPEAGKEQHQKQLGSVMVVSFEINGQSFVGLNGGPQFKFTPAISFVINCEDQNEVDYYWEKLSEGGDPTKQACGWLGDKYGLSWQIVPNQLFEMMKDPDKTKANRVYETMMKMKKFDIAELKKAFNG